MSRCSVLLTLFVFILGSALACGSSDSGEQVDCIRDTDCSEGEICRNAICVDASDPCLLIECDPGFRCQDGECVPVDPCATLVCDAPPGDAVCFELPGSCTAGVCHYTQRADGSTCDDADACTMSDTCMQGQCVGTALVCDAPPADLCLDGTTLRNYAATGQCQAGDCDYPFEDSVCEHTCFEAQCRPAGFCSELDAMRCEGALVQRCDGASWQTLSDCSEMQLNCEMDGALAQCDSQLCADGQSCDPTYNEARTCLVDGLPPPESPLCGAPDYACPENMVCAMQEPFGEDGYRCMTFCGACSAGLTCEPSELIAGLSLCMDDGQVPVLLDCDSQEQLCPGNRLCLPVDSGFENWGCFEVCSPPPCQPDCSGRQCGPDGCGGLCGQCADGAGCADGVCVSLCPAGLDCGILNWGDVTLCLDDGQIPLDAPACGNEGCPNDMGCFPDSEGGQMRCVELCGICPAGETCDTWEVASDWIIHLCMVGGAFPAEAPACNDSYMCEGNAVCVSDGAEYLCANVCSGPHP